MQGYTGSFAINGTNLSLQPTEFRWVDKDLLGKDGQGRPVYPSIGEFEMSWGLMSNSELKQLIDFSNAILSTGTAVVDLPKWGHPDYYFYSYSGTFITAPSVGAYFNTYVTNVKLTVTNIGTG